MNLGVGRPARRVQLPQHLLLQYSLGCIGIVVLIGCWYVQELERARVQEHAVDRLLRLNASVYFDHEMPGGLYDSGGKPFFPNWIRERTSSQFGMHVVEVNLLTAKPRDEDLLPLQSLRTLRRLMLDNSPQVTDEGLAQLAELKQLHELTLSRTSIRGHGLVHLHKLRQLRILRLQATEVDDRALSHLWPLHRLEVLELGSTQITRQAGRLLLEFPGLRRLGLQNTAIDDRSLVYLARLKSLELLDLSYSRVTPDGVRWLRGQLPKCDVYCEFARTQSGSPPGL